MNRPVVAAHDARSGRQPDSCAGKLVDRVQALERVEQVGSVLHVKSGAVIGDEEAWSAVDLIYAQPGQTEAAWRAELRAALTLAADHLSLYQLTIEPETPFFGLHAAGKLKVPDEDVARALYDVTQDVCAQHLRHAGEARGCGRGNFTRRL